YLKLIIVDNYGADFVSVRDVIIEGYDEGIGLLTFDLDNTGNYKNYYLPIYDILQGPLTRMRVVLHRQPKAEIVSERQSRPQHREALAIDYIRVVRSPEIWKVRGCLDRYFDNPNLFNPQYNVRSRELVINGQLPIYYFDKLEMDLVYASTYDCPHSGGVDVRIDGLNFGSHPRVFIDDNECPISSTGSVSPGSRDQFIICTLPPSSAYRSGTVGADVNNSIVRVESGTLPGLFQSAPYFRYRAATPAPNRPTITNIGARRVDIMWEPPGTEFDNLMTTGYKIVWFQAQYRSRVSNLTVGNVTTTSIRAATNAAILPTDLYGRRDPLSDAIESPISIFTDITSTLPFDFDFQGFDANTTLNSSGTTVSSSNGPTGQYGPEGNYGLVIVGSAQVENCNASMTCCDGFNELAYDYVYDGITRRQVPSNVPYDDGAPPEKVVLTLQELIAIQGAEMPSMPCGPALRLTPSGARESGAVWYSRKANVREGFDTTITFQISNPSMRCNRLDDVNTYCRSRGADGLAFVLQDATPVALGSAGSGMGYEGIFNSLAIELDTFFNYDQMDYYENHIGVMTQ
ncbi:unnamed protein product, partial [Symbiodinium microadriaticum]